MKLAFERTCSNCDAFLANKDLQVKAGLPRQGWCRANPPVVVQTMAAVMTARGPEMQPVFQGAFPPVTSEWWCRQWRPIFAQTIDHQDMPDATNKPAA